MMENAVFSI